MIGLTKEELRSIIRDEADGLTYEATTDLLLDIARGAERDENSSPLDRILWAVRMAYLAGFSKAAECFNEALLMSRKEENDNGEAQS